MPYQVRTEKHPAGGGLDGTVTLLEDIAGQAQAAVWPAFGFNCYQWRVAREGRSLDLLYADPLLFHNSKPTRSGSAILFPFPNRLRQGRFTWQGKTYEVRRNDTLSKNAIHGFVCWKPWRVVDQGADAASAWVTGEFRASQDAPESLPSWPADYQIRITYRLTTDHLRIETQVSNPDRVPLPFALGFHPYFRLPFTPALAAADCWVQVPAAAYWTLEDSLPTGVRRPVDSSRDLQSPRRFTDLALDDVLTDLQGAPENGPERLYLRGVLQSRPLAAEMRMYTSADFREVVVYTPPHRQALALEPYTAPTDAINLQARGIEAGLQVLPPGGQWSGIVEMRI